MSYTHLLFDLGGVIVELKGTPIKAEWFNEELSSSEIWEKWLQSSAPKSFESGKCSKEDFARNTVKELSLSVDDQHFLEYFETLPVAPFPGAIALLNKIKTQYQTALLSNSNEIHWDKKMKSMKLAPCFDHYFASHLMGLVKPDPAAFDYVISCLNVPASQILFFDDNQLNVDAAIRAGMHAKKIVGVEQLQSALSQLPTWRT